MLKRRVIGFAAIGLLLVALSIALWPCSATTYCSNGRIVWCQVIWPCTHESCSAGADYVECFCASDIYIRVFCDGTGKVPAQPPY